MTILRPRCWTEFALLSLYLFIRTAAINQQKYQEAIILLQNLFYLIRYQKIIKTDNLLGKHTYIIKEPKCHELAQEFESKNNTYFSLSEHESARPQIIFLIDCL